MNFRVYTDDARHVALGPLPGLRNPRFSLGFGLHAGGQGLRYTIGSPIIVLTELYNDISIILRTLP